MSAKKKKSDKDELPAVPDESAGAVSPDEPTGPADGSREAAPEEEAEAGLAELEAELAAARAETADFRDRWLRAVAELDNVRKRSRRDVEEAHLYGQTGLLRDLLEVQDNLGLAMRSAGPAGEVTSDLESLRAGVALIRQRLAEVLARQGIAEIPALGEPFDPARHEAVREIEVEGVPSGQVTEVVQPGYRLHDRVLRPSRVVVAR